MKSYVLCVILLFGVCQSEGSFSLEETCRLSKQSKLCWFGENIACENVQLCPGGIMIDFTDKEIQDIVNEHNKLRSNLASGSINGFSSAAHMGAVKWDTELQTMVKQNIRRCVSEHDKCRSTANYPSSGQNLAYIKGYNHGTFNRQAAVAEFKTMINDWFNEIKDADRDIVSNFQSNGKFITHFTAIALEQNNRIGCSGVWYPVDGTGQVNFGCNYPSITWQNSPVYVAGAAGSQCTSGRDKNFPALCSTNENYKK